MTVWDLVANELQNNGIDVYPPDVHEGDCTSPYCVFKDGGSTITGLLSTQTDLYTLLCYVPRQQYTLMKEYTEKCKNAVQSLAPMVMPTGKETETFYDDTVKGYMKSVQYRNHRRNKLL